MTRFKFGVLREGACSVSHVTHSAKSALGSRNVKRKPRVYWGGSLEPQPTTMKKLAMYFPVFVLLPILPFMLWRSPELDAPPMSSFRKTASSQPTVLLTYASERFFDRLENFVGSVHLWEPSLPIIVYDLGLSTAQRQAIACWRSVLELRAFNFSAYPPHVRELKNFAWKVIIIWETLQQYQRVMYVLLIPSAC